MDDDAMDAKEIQHADPGARRRAVLTVVLFAALGTPALWGVQHYRADWSGWLAGQVGFLRANCWVVPVAIIVLFAPFLAFAAHSWRLGARVVAIGRFPPPGHRTVRDTEVLIGGRAVARGRVLQVLGILLVAACVALPLLGWLVVAALAG